MPTEARAAQNAEIGPLPVPSTSWGSPSTEIAAASFCLPSTTDEDWWSSSATAPSARYSRLNDVPDLGRGDLAALFVGADLDHLGELDLQAARQVERVAGLHDVGDAALARLAVDPDDGLVGAADVVRVDRQVRDVPRVLAERHARRLGLRLERLEALLDRVLVRAGERGVDQLARVRVAGVHRELVDVLGGAADLVDVAEVDHRVDALAEQVQAQGDQADVAGALAVAEQAALDPVGAGQHGQLGVGDRGAPVVVGVHRHADVLAPRQVAGHPLDLVRVHVRGGPLDGAGQVEDDLAARAGLPDVHHRLAGLQGEVELGVHEDLGRVLVAEVGAVAEDLLRVAA